MHANPRLANGEERPWIATESAAEASDADAADALTPGAGAARTRLTEDRIRAAAPVDASESGHATIAIASCPGRGERDAHARTTRERPNARTPARAGEDGITSWVATFAEQGGLATGWHWLGHGEVAGGTVHTLRDAAGRACGGRVDARRNIALEAATTRLRDRKQALRTNVS